MALEQFTWHARNIARGEETQRLRENDYGDGYSQVTGDGINAVTEAWPLTFAGRLAYVDPIRKFLRRHRGGKAFAWTPPAGELGLFCYKTAIGWEPKGGDFYVLTVTFTTTFHP